MKKYQPPTERYFKLPNNIFDLHLNPIQFALYAYLVCCSGNKGYCWPSLETIARKTGVGKTSVQEHLKVLMKRQMIKVGKHPNPYGHQSNEYYLLSLDNPEVYRDFSQADAPGELPFDIYDDLPA